MKLKRYNENLGNKKYLLEIFQNGGCDYTICCGKDIIELKSSNYDDALEEVRFLMQEEYKGDRRLNSIKIHEVYNSIDIPIEEAYETPVRTNFSKKFIKESISEEELTRISEIGEDMWGIKYPFIGLSKMDIRRISSEAFLPPPGGFNKGIFATPRSITANNKEVVVLIEFMNLKKSDDRSFRVTASKLAEASGKKVDYRSKMVDGKIFVEFKFS